MDVSKVSVAVLSGGDGATVSKVAVSVVSGGGAAVKKITATILEQSREQPKTSIISG